MVLIILSADYFTNGVEWLGFILGLGEGAVGSLLAALGTALPETLVPVMAMAFGASQVSDAIGLGAILGAPLMLATLAFMIIGIGLWSHRRVTPRLQKGSLERDLTFFIGSFGLAIVTGFLPSSWHTLMACVLILGYVAHAWTVVHLNRDTERVSPPADRLHLGLGSIPVWLMAWVQVAMALSGMILGARFFVMALDHASASLSISGFFLSVIITPIATELPEVLNSVLWIRRGKDTLAFGNVTGAMAFQASVVPALGIFLTPWRLTGWELAAAALAWGSASWILWRSHQKRLSRGPLLMAGLFYLTFIGLMLAWG
jgi:cation:H+ antiporter